jgi:two-component system cell cycle sensor histidine kinase PleC
LTNLHGGSMRLWSKLGAGTVVCISLPRDGRKTRAKLPVAA